jgi:hypothetical protein
MTRIRLSVFVVFGLALVLGLISGSVCGQDSKPNTLGGLPVDKISTDAILKATTEKRFLTPLVSAMPDHPDIPSPRDSCRCR